MVERVKYSLVFSQKDLRLEWISKWFEVGCTLFKPSVMSGNALTQKKYMKFSQKKFRSNFVGEMDDDKINVSIKDKCNNVYICSNANVKDIVRFNFILSKDICGECVDEMIDMLMQKGGIVAYKCSLTDNNFQNEEEISNYEFMEWSLSGVKTKQSVYSSQRTVVDIEYNPGHSHTVNGIWFGSCYRMWFGKEYYQYINKEKLQSFTNCYENCELENEVTRITLYENMWDYAKTENREIQWDFRKSVGMDEVAHELKAHPRKQNDPEVEILTGTFPHGGVRLIHQYFDESGKRVSKSIAKSRQSAEYSSDGKILFKEEKNLE